MDLGSITATIGIGRAVLDAVRSRSARRLGLAVRRKWPVACVTRASDVYTGFGLWSAVDARPPSDGITVEDLARLRRRAVPITPAAVVLYPRFLLPNAECLVDELFLTQVRRELPDLRQWTLIVDQLPGAGGRGSEASFSVALHPGMAVPVPLFARAIADGGQVEKPLLRNGDHYEITLWVFPTQVGLYSYELRARCMSDGREWIQPLAAFKLLQIGNEPPAAAAVVETFAGDHVAGVHAAIPPLFLQARMNNLNGMQAPPLQDGRAVFVRGSSRAAPLYSIRPRAR